MYRQFLQNHVLATLAFALILIVGVFSYQSLPRQQDPTVDFNWIQITTVLPGASAEDVEKRITEPLEDAIRIVDNIRFTNSSSVSGLSTILVRFEQVDEETFDKRVTDLRREVQNESRLLPEEAEDPQILEITSANQFPTAQIVVSGIANDENLRVQARTVRDDLEIIEGVSRVYDYGFNEPELRVEFIPERLHAADVSPTLVVDTIRAAYRDTVAGDVDIGRDNWLVRVLGASDDPDVLAQLPVITPNGEIRLGSIARVYRSHEEAEQLVGYQGRPAVLMSVMKSEDTNTLELVDRLHEYIAGRQRLSEQTGVNVELVDDQTQATRDALRVMQTNAALGLLFVLLIAWAFLGLRIALLTAVAIPFILCGTFWVLYAIDSTLNVIVLLGIVISLGMLVDDAVVVVEAIYHRLQRGATPVEAGVDAVREVFSPVTAAVLTTMAAFLPLTLMPGIVGEFMFYVPFIVAVALAISLIEAYWMLPAHVIAFNIQVKRDSSVQIKRTRALHRIRIVYVRWLVKAVRHPGRVLGAAFLAFALAVLATPLMNFDFFASDPMRLFYINVKMPAGSPLDETLNTTLEIENKVRGQLKADELRSVVSYSGLMFTETEPYFGDRYGQVVVSLLPARNGMRGVSQIIDAVDPAVKGHPGVEEVSITRMSGGPPVGKPITIKVRGDNFDKIRAAVADLTRIMQDTPGVKDIAVDDTPGKNELRLQLKHKAIRQAGLTPADITRIARLYADGEVATTLQSDGEELDVRVRAWNRRTDARFASADALLNQPVPLPGGGTVPLGELVSAERTQGMSRIRHYNYRRSIQISADIDQTVTDEVSANNAILEAWRDGTAERHPSISLDTSGILDDIFESLIWMAYMLGVGVLLIYLILGTQFNSYWQPFLILSTVPLAFTGVALGMLVNRNPVSVWTIFGMVALTGIAVNAAIMLITAANRRVADGMSILHATVYAARRRVIPILITSLTTIGGLFSLAFGLGGYSLLWGPMAASIVWGLAFSSVLTLFVIPVLYEYFTRLGVKIRRRGGWRKIVVD